MNQLMGRPLAREPQSDVRLISVACETLEFPSEPVAVNPSRPFSFHCRPKGSRRHDVRAHVLLKSGDQLSLSFQLANRPNKALSFRLTPRCYPRKTRPSWRPCLPTGSCFVRRGLGRPGAPFDRAHWARATAFDAAMEDIGLAIDHMVIAGRDWADRGQDERQRALNRLRDAGYDLLTILAHEKDRDGFVKELLKTDYVQAAGERNVPWEFLYLGSRQEPAVLQNFLGAHAAVGFPGDRQDVPGWLGQTTSLRSDNRYAIRPPGQPLISGLAEDHTLDSR